MRQRPDETPSHGGGLSAEAQKRLDARRRLNNMPSSSVTAVAPSRDANGKTHALDDFQSRLNRNTTSGRRGDDRREDQWRDEKPGRSWNDQATPRTSRRDEQADGGSMRVPNRGWDETPRHNGPGGWGKRDDSRRKMGWDETPRSQRGGDNDDLEVNGKEWEEEQVRLDRDWYSHDDEGAVVSEQWSLGDEESGVLTIAA